MLKEKFKEETSKQLYILNNTYNESTCSIQMEPLTIALPDHHLLVARRKTKVLLPFWQSLMISFQTRN